MTNRFDAARLHPILIAVALVATLVAAAALLIAGSSAGRQAELREQVTSLARLQIFVMVGLSIVIENAALLWWSADFRTVTLDYLRIQIVLGPYPGLGLEEVIINPGRLIAFFVGLAISVAFYFFLKLSYSGKIIRATSQDRSTALLMGIDIDKVYRLTFAVGLLLVGVAGALMIPMFTVHPFVCFEFGLVMFVVVVFGGMGSVVGAVLAWLFIGVVEVFSDFVIGPDSKQAV